MRRNVQSHSAPAAARHDQYACVIMRRHNAHMWLTDAFICQQRRQKRQVEDSKETGTYISKHARPQLITIDYIRPTHGVNCGIYWSYIPVHWPQMFFISGAKTRCCAAASVLILLKRLLTAGDADVSVHRVKWRHISMVAIRSPFCRSTPSYCA